MRDINNDYTPLKPLTPFKLCVLQNFPFIEADFDAVTNYQLLCKVVEYLNNVIDNNNKQNSNIKQVEDNFINLYNYVQNYFNNLDVQDEIDKKLDEMADSGELLTLFTKYYPIVTPNMYGCVGDGVTDDTENFNRCINSVKGKAVNLVLSGKYKIDTLIIDEYITINGNSGEIICNTLEVYKDIADNHHTLISNILINSKNGVVISGGKNIVLDNCTILTDNVGIEITNTKYSNYENIIQNCCIYANTFGNIGILINSSDSSINNINMRDFKTAYKGNWQCTVYNLHSWISRNEYINGSIFCDITGGSPYYGEISLIGSCIDTYQTAFKLSKNPYVHISNCRSVFNNGIYGNNIAPTLFNIDYAYPIEYLRLFLNNNNFIGNYENEGTLSNIYITPILSNNFIGGWKYYNNYNFQQYSTLDTLHLPSDYTADYKEFWNNNLIYIAFSITGTFNKQQTQLFYYNQTPNNKGIGINSFAVQTDESGNAENAIILSNDTGLYVTPTKSAKLTINGYVCIVAPWEHTD